MNAPASIPQTNPLPMNPANVPAGLQTPVIQFAEWHDQGGPQTVRARRYQRLLPLTTPGPNEQYAFEVDLDQCTGCKACAVACHSLNGLDDDETWRDIGTLLDPESEQPFLQTVTSACHHCEEPACAHGCPVLAYDKDPSTGIVRHLDDQCIGCSYCILKCPYDVPKFNQARGIVRKCDMCQDRLAVGEAPACVQACPNEAITIRLVNRGLRPGPSETLLPGTFPSDYTRPTTTYVSRKPLPATARPASAGRLRLDPGHMPLAWMLVLTQMGTGAFLFTLLPFLTPAKQAAVSGIGATSTLAGLTLGVLHLGQPLKAWRAFLGWRRSWLSREIILFGAFAFTAALSPLVWLFTRDAVLLRLGLLAAALTGGLGVACSVMVYVDTRRPFWSFTRVTARFAGTSVILGSGAVALATGDPLTSWVAASASSLYLAADFRDHRKALADPGSPVHVSARTAAELLAPSTKVRRILLGSAALLFVPASWALHALPAALAMALISLLIERHHFFVACAGPRMPGN